LKTDVNLAAIKKTASLSLRKTENTQSMGASKCVLQIITEENKRSSIPVWLWKLIKNMLTYLNSGVG